MLPRELDRVLYLDVDMIVMGSHGYSSVSATLLGSVTMTVASECDVPLLIVR